MARSPRPPRPHTPHGSPTPHAPHTLTIALVSSKGGVGKTTLATSLASCAHLAGKRTLVVDMDRQGSSLDWSAARSEASRLAGLAVVKADRALPLPRMREIARGHDLVVLDTPPRLGDVLRAAVVASDVALVALRPGPFDMWAASETLSAIDEADGIRAQLGALPVLRMFVVNLAQVGTVLARQAPAALEEHGQLAGVVHARIAFPEAAAVGETVASADPEGPGAYEIARLYKTIQTAHAAHAAQTTRTAHARGAA